MKIMNISFTLMIFIQVLIWFLSYLTLNQYENETQFHLAIFVNDNVLKSQQGISFTPKNIHNGRVSIHV